MTTTPRLSLVRVVAVLVAGVVLLRAIADTLYDPTVEAEQITRDEARDA